MFAGAAPKNDSHTQFSTASDLTPLMLCLAGQGRPIAEQFDFQFEPDAEFLCDCAAGQGDQCADVGGGGSCRR